METKYEVALGRAKMYYNNAKEAGDYSAVARYENIFPELAECEDERIIKSIISVLENDKKHYLQEIAWLEKQKEQKSNQSDDEREYVKTLKGLVSDFIRNSGGCITDVAYYQRICDWLDERHIEQKPAEKQDYSGFNDLERAIHRGFLSAGVENVPRTIIEETAKECIAQMKSAEWSEEDEIVYKSIKCILLSKARFGVESRWFDSIKTRIMPNKTMEWSDSDVKMLKRLIDRLNYITCDTRTDGTSPNITFFDEIEWLKSLRPQPHWKPSEEQINLLKWLAKGIDVASHERHILDKMIDDLKKQI